MAWAVKIRNKAGGTRGYAVFRELKLGAPSIEILGAIFPNVIDETAMAEKQFPASLLPTKVKRQLMRLVASGRDAPGADHGAGVGLMKAFDAVFGAERVEKALHREDALFDP